MMGQIEPSTSKWSVPVGGAAIACGIGLAVFAHVAFRAPPLEEGRSPVPAARGSQLGSGPGPEAGPFPLRHAVAMRPSSAPALDPPLCDALARLRRRHPEFSNVVDSVVPECAGWPVPPLRVGAAEPAPVRREAAAPRPPAPPGAR